MKVRGKGKMSRPQIWLKTIVAMIVFLSFIARLCCGQQLSGGLDPCAGKNFYRPSISGSALFSLQFEGAVLRIVLTSPTGEILEEGTGYLIDAKRGYVITAAHVVTPALKDKSIKISATSPRLGQAPLGLRVFSSDSADDVAILKVSDVLPLIQNDVQPLDIVLHFRNPSPTYYTIGYPNGEKTPSPQKVQLEGASETSGLLKVGQHVEEGSSGSPLIDDEGAVVATLIDSTSMDRALYRPLVDVRSLLDKIPPDSTARSINRWIASPKDSTGSARYAMLIQKFQWVAGNPSNLELYEWANSISGNSVADKQWEAYVSCPILPAYSDRLLVDAIPESILIAGPPASRATVLLAKANEAVFLRRFDLAFKDSQQARSIFRTEEDTAGEARASITAGVADLYQHNFNDAAERFRFAVGIQHPGADSARTEVYLAQADEGRGDSASASRRIRDILPELHQSKDRDGEGIAYYTWGKAAEQDGDYQAAINHFMSSLDYFKKSGNVRGVDMVQADLGAAVAVRSQESWEKKSSEFTRRHWLAIVIILVVIVLAAVGGFLVWKMTSVKKAAKAEDEQETTEASSGL